MKYNPRCVSWTTIHATEHGLLISLGGQLNCIRYWTISIYIIIILLKIRTFVCQNILPEGAEVHWVVQQLERIPFRYDYGCHLFVRSGELFQPPHSLHSTESYSHHSKENDPTIINTNSQPNRDGKHIILQIWTC